MNRSIRIALLFVVFAAWSALPSSAADTVRKFHGTTTCEAMQVEVSFTYDMAALQIRDFSSEHRCLKGGHAMAWEVPKIDVRNDGSFSFKDEYGGSVDGKIDGDEATGEFNKFTCRLRCADQEFHSPCQNFSIKAGD